MQSFTEVFTSRCCFVNSRWRKWKIKNAEGLSKLSSGTGNEKDAETSETSCWCSAYVNMESCALKYRNFFSPNPLVLRSSRSPQKHSRMNISAAANGMRNEMGGRNRSFPPSTSTKTYLAEIIKFIFALDVCTVSKRDRVACGKDLRHPTVGWKSVIAFLFCAFCWIFSNCLISRVSHTRLERHCAFDYFIGHMKNPMESQQSSQSRELGRRLNKN